MLFRILYDTEKEAPVAGAKSPKYRPMSPGSLAENRACQSDQAVPEAGTA